MYSIFFKCTEVFPWKGSAHRSTWVMGLSSYLGVIVWWSLSFPMCLVLFVSPILELQATPPSKDILSRFGGIIMGRQGNFKVCWCGSFLALGQYGLFWGICLSSMLNWRYSASILKDGGEGLVRELVVGVTLWNHSEIPGISSLYLVVVSVRWYFCRLPLYIYIHIFIYIYCNYKHMFLQNDIHYISMWYCHFSV